MTRYRVTHTDIPDQPYAHLAKFRILRQDEVSVLDEKTGEMHSWWRGVVEVPGGIKYFSVALPIEGDREAVLRSAFAEHGVKFEDDA